MPLNKINITFALPNLLPGGAERVISYIAANIDAEKFNSTLLIVGHKKDASYDIDNIQVVYLEQPRVLNGIIPLYKYIKREKPDIVVSAIGHLNTVTAYMSLLFPKVKFVAREVNVLSVLETFDQPNRLNPIHYFGDKRFNFFDKVICQSQDMLDDLNKTYSIKQEKLILINNPVTDNFVVKTRTTKQDPIRFITVARFDKEKGHPRLLKALSQLDYPFHYTIIGRGAQEKVIFDLIVDYGLTDRITHIPFTKEVPRLLAESDLYLQGSYVEGFPNAVIESCMVGTPVLAIDAPGGINEIIYEGVNGHIAKDEDAFLSLLKSIQKDYNFNPEKVSETIKSRYSSEIILKKYEELFQSLMN